MQNQGGGRGAAARTARPPAPSSRPRAGRRFGPVTPAGARAPRRTGLPGGRDAHPDTRGSRRFQNLPRRRRARSAPPPGRLRLPPLPGSARLSRRHVPTSLSLPAPHLPPTPNPAPTRAPRASQAPGAAPRQPQPGGATAGDPREDPGRPAARERGAGSGPGTRRGPAARALHAAGRSPHVRGARLPSALPCGTLPALLPRPLGG